MQIIECELNDFVYPLSREIFYDPKVVYHGTRSNHSQGIMSNGWQMNYKPYDLNDAMQIWDAFDSIGYEEVCPVSKAFQENVGA